MKMLDTPEVYHQPSPLLEWREIIKTLVTLEVYHGSSPALETTETLETIKTLVTQETQEMIKALEM